MAGKLSEDQVGELQEIFNLFDNRGDNKIAMHQLGEVLRASGLNPTEADVKKCEHDSDRRITFEEYMPIYQSMMKLKDHTPISEFIEGFKVFDKDDVGSIASAELRHLLTSLGEKLTEEEVEQLLQPFETDQGNINYEEFVKGIVAS